MACYEAQIENFHRQHFCNKDSSVGFSVEFFLSPETTAEMFIAKSSDSAIFFSRNLELGSLDHWDKDQADSSQRWRCVVIYVLQVHRELVTFFGGGESSIG